MSQQLNLDFLDAEQPTALHPPTGARQETRSQLVRIVEYTPYPRRTRNERRRIGFTRNTSPSGMCLAVENREIPGALLRVVRTDVDGNASTDALARVAWCEPRGGSRYWLGLDVISDANIGRMLKVRHTAHSQKIAVHS